MRAKFILFFFIFCLFGVRFCSAEEPSEFKKKCIGCHKEALGKWDVGLIKHSPYQEGKCESCHSSEHKKFTSDDLSKPCLICHDLASEKIKKVHFSANLSTSKCSSCHYTHASDKKGLLKEIVHMPFSSGSCDICHNLSADGKVEVKTPVKKVCLACHSEIIAKEDTLIHSAYENLECTGCHNPHTSAEGKLLVKKTSDLCFDCHDKKQAEKHPYDVAPSSKIILEKGGKICLNYTSKVDCASCHKPHASSIPFLLKDSPEKGKLCYHCHKQE